MNERPDLLNDEAIKLSRSGLYDEAIACFKRALLIEKENHLIWFNLGLTFRDAGMLEDAVDALEKARSIPESDGNEDLMEALAVTYFDLGNFDMALEVCNEGLEINESNAQLWNTAGAVFFNQGNFTDAQESFEAAVILNPYYPEALYNLRDTYRELKNQAGYEDCARRLSQLKIAP